VLNAQRLTYGDNPEAWLLLAVNNVTEARLTARQKDELVQEKQVLLQELQHRVANSLQIIASVLMLGARKVQSDEARIHLNDAHQRVMAIAKLQRQLSTSGADGVPLGTYLEDLCGSIAASMILQPDTLKITTAIDDYVASPEQSVSFGLIVTELVINALKYAFPEHLQHGIITVDFTAAGVGWTLAVADNGIGKAPTAQPGLGTGIVEALAKQLNARIEVRDADPGTRVLVIHDPALQQCDFSGSREARNVTPFAPVADQRSLRRAEAQPFSPVPLSSSGECSSLLSVQQPHQRRCGKAVENHGKEDDKADNGPQPI